MRRRRVRVLMGLAAIALVASCTSATPSTTATTVTTSAPPTTTAAPAAAATSTIPGPPAGPTTAATPAAPAAAAQAPAVAIVPEVVCVDVDRGLGPLSGVTTTAGTGVPATSDVAVLRAESLVYFGYRNAADVPVAVALGEGNRLDGGAEDDDPLLPSVFAPGRVSPAFVAIVARDGAVPTWTLRGTDGVVRTAAPTVATPACNGPIAATPDTRAPRVSVTFGPTVVGTAAAPQVAVTVRLDGLPAASVCPAGLSPLPPLVKLLVLDRPVTTGADGAARVDLPVGPLPFTSPPLDGVRVRTSAFVADRCQGAGAVTTGWATSVAIDLLADSLAATCAVVEGTAVRPATQAECEALAATGGVKVHRAP